MKLKLTVDVVPVHPTASRITVEAVTEGHGAAINRITRTAQVPTERVSAKMQDILRMLAALTEGDGR